MVSELLYKRAAACGVPRRSLWHVGDGISIFAGPLTRNAAHRHSVPVLLTGVYGTFRLKIGAEPWLSCRAAVVPAGVSYEFDMAGEVLAVVYLEPSVAGVAALVPLVRGARDVGGALIGDGGRLGVMRALFEDQESATWTGAALQDLLDSASRRARHAIDARIACAVRDLQGNADARWAAAHAATSVGLSASRFQHLFAAEVGVPFRRYRGWQRMLSAIREIVSGETFAAAAHGAGYADQSHFAHDFRRTFGAAASPSLMSVRG